MDCGFSVSGRFSQSQADNKFGGGLIKDEKKRKGKLTIDELVKAFSEESQGSESEGINEEGKDEDLENIQGKNIQIDDLYSDSDSDSDFCYFDGTKPLDYYERRNRVQEVHCFTINYKFSLGKKICVHPYGPPIHCLSDKCFESSWVGVHGMLSICMVIRRDMDMTRLHASYQKDSMKHHNMRMFARAAISEVECLPHKDADYYDDAFRRSCADAVTKPFAVVSLGPSPFAEPGHEDSNPHDCCVSKTISFLESHVSSDLLDTHYGTIRAAIKAYQLMCHKQLRAEDIWVTILNVSSGGLFDHLPMDIIGEQLALVNGLSSEKDHQKPLFVFRGLPQKEYLFE